MKRVVLILGMCLGSILLTGQNDIKYEILNKYDPNSRFKVISYYDGDTTQIREIGYVAPDGKTKVGEWVLYNRDGTMNSSASFDNKGNKHGAWKVWCTDGSLKVEMYYEHGKRIGVWKAYHTDGTVETKNYDL